MDCPSVVFDHCTPFSHPDVIRVRHRNLSPSTQFDPKRFERDLLHRIPQIIKHSSSIRKLTRTVKAAWQLIHHLSDDASCSVAAIRHRTKSRKRLASGEHRLPACSFRQPAEKLLGISTRKCLMCRFVWSASCRPQQASSLRSPDSRELAYDRFHTCKKVVS